jgi:16S rRNA (cytidine1402-2'-O)-methyltransferase
LQQDPHGSRGEFVVMIHGATPEPDSEQTTLETDRLLTILLTELPVKTVAKMVAEITGRKKNELYQRALQLKSGG